MNSTTGARNLPVSESKSTPYPVAHDRSNNTVPDSLYVMSNTMYANMIKSYIMLTKSKIRHSNAKSMST